MLKKIAAALALAMACTGALAAPASAESVEKLLVLGKSDKLVDSMHVAMEGIMRQAMQQAVGDKRLTPEQQRAIETVPARYTAVMRTEMNWESIKPEMVRLYQDVFTQEEVDALVAFYNTPAGQAMIDKMPVLMQRSMALGQARMQAVMPRMLRAIEQGLNDAGIPTR